jgi:hypothetical protein
MRTMVGMGTPFGRGRAEVESARCRGRARLRARSPRPDSAPMRDNACIPDAARTRLLSSSAVKSPPGWVWNQGRLLPTSSGSAPNDDASSSHGVAMPMRDLPVALFAAVYLRCS